MRLNLFLLAMFGAIFVLSPMANAVTDGRIANVTWPSKSVYCPQESIPFQVTIQNTGSELRTFWVGYSVQDSNGHWWNEPEVAQQTASIRPGGNSSIGLSWNPRDDAPRGSFTARMRLWEGWREDGPIGEIDNKIKPNAFQLNSSSGFKNDIVKPGFRDCVIRINCSCCGC